MDDLTPTTVQLEVLPNCIADMDNLMRYCDLTTRKDLFDNAIMLFEWAIHEVLKGRKIASYDQDNDKLEVVKFQALDNAGRNVGSSKITLVPAKLPLPND